MVQKIILFGFLIAVFFSCKDDVNTVETAPDVPKVATVLAPSNNSKAVCGQEIAVKIEVSDLSAVASISVYLNDSLIKSVPPLASIMVGVPTKTAHVGKNDIKIEMHLKNGKIDIDNRMVVLFSDVYSDIEVAKIIREYPHSKTSYTQGLEFYNGTLYEGTGLTGQSFLAKINLATGEASDKQTLPDNIFGEGITILNGKIYELTWQARLCYVYDLKTLTREKELTYFGEGWGLTNDGINLLMSNGTSEIVYRDPITFEKIKSISVFDGNQEYVSLNELEYIDGVLYANVYQDDFILKIDPQTGKVLAKIDCSDVVKAGKGLGDVLNGIAYNKQDKKLYITGKNWPKLFEVKFVAP